MERAGGTTGITTAFRQPPFFLGMESEIRALDIPLSISFHFFSYFPFPFTSLGDFYDGSWGRMVWVDMSTQYPVYVLKGDELRTYASYTSLDIWGSIARGI